MLNIAFAIVAVTICATALACSGAEEPTADELIAVARQGVEQNIDEAVGMVVSHLLRDTDIPAGLASGIVSARVKESIEWQYRVVPDRKNPYVVTATANLDFDVALPLVGTFDVDGALPFEVRLDWDQPEQFRNMTPVIEQASLAIHKR